MKIRLTLDRIYKPVQHDLQTVDALIKSVSNVEYHHLSELLNYSLKDGGKKIRPALVLLSGKFYNFNLDTLIPMAAAVELLHTATLIHDDAIDQSPVRRGRPTVNIAWNDDQAILLGDYLFAKAEELTTRTGNIRVIRLSAETLEILTTGELNQEFNAFNANQKYDEYIARIAAKTASLIQTTTESGAILSGAPENAINSLKIYGYNLGIAFQIVDDILDFTGTEKELGKPVGSDLSQGTLTLPAILLLQHYSKDNPVQRYFADPQQKELVGKAVDMLKNSPIIDECYKAALEYHRVARQELLKLPDSDGRRALLELADFVVERRK
jgi:geranylgeranyl pyrophosphate synthase